MKNPRLIQETIKGATYVIPTYEVTSNGVEDSLELEVKFCKGAKDDETVFRQSGVFVETLIQLAKQHLENVNVGELSSRDTSIAITKLDEALMWLNKRTEDRKLRDVLSTYKK